MSNAEVQRLKAQLQELKHDLVEARNAIVISKGIRLPTPVENWEMVIKYTSNFETEIINAENMPKYLETLQMYIERLFSHCDSSMRRHQEKIFRALGYGPGEIESNGVLYNSILESLFLNIDTILPEPLQRDEELEILRRKSGTGSDLHKDLLHVVLKSCIQPHHFVYDPTREMKGTSLVSTNTLRRPTVILPAYFVTLAERAIQVGEYLWVD